MERNWIMPIDVSALPSAFVVLLRVFYFQIWVTLEVRQVNVRKNFVIFLAQTIWLKAFRSFDGFSVLILNKAS